MKTKEKKKIQIVNGTKDYILKEAEMVISNYISNIEDRNERSVKQNDFKKKYNRLKMLSICLSIAIFVLIIF